MGQKKLKGKNTIAKVSMAPKMAAAFEKFCDEQQKYLTSEVKRKANKRRKKK